MAEWVNFREVREKVSLELVLSDLYGVTGLTRAGDTLIGPCPVHGGDSPRAFHADLSKNVWHCFSRCKAGGNQLDFVARREGISVREAALLLKHRYLDASGPAPPRLPQGPRPGHAAARKPGGPPRGAPPSARGANDDVEQEEDGNAPLDLKLNLKPWHPHLTDERQLTQATIDHFGVGYCSAGILRGMIAIPIHDAVGALVAYAGRRLRPSDIEKYGKYKLPRGFRKELELFNYHRASAHMESEGLIVVEGFFSVLRLHQAGFENAVATMGCEVSQAQAELLCRAREVLILFDGDRAGREGAQALAALLGSGTRVRVGDLPDGAEPETLGDRGLRWLIRGMRALDLEHVALRLAPGSAPS